FEQLPVLRALLRDEVFFVRAHAARAVGELGSQALAAEVARLLGDENWWTRAAAKESLLALGPVGLEAARAMADDEDRFARDGAAEIVDAFERKVGRRRRTTIGLAQGVVR
ncbi:MAG TPA: HEAT repeat domain-containing protein, partial [Gaiellaceae bacterium]|nr:HEAT repeat domain-containing protein [Gaiellaceae bacterium]